MATNPKTKKIIIWSSVAVVLGVGGYFLFQYLKKRREGNGNTEVDGGNVLTEPTPSPTPSAEVSSDRPTSKEDIKAFQNYVLTVKKDTTILGKSGADGVWGSNSQKAWDKYGSDYKKAGTPSNDKELERSINLILAKATGDKAKRSYLEKVSATFVKKWAQTIDADKKAFTWGNKTWRTKTGEKLLDFDPIGVSMKTNSGGIYAYEWASKTSSKIGVGGNLNVGKVRAITFDGETVWFYLPDNGGNNKWGRSQDFKKA